jgi:hypothetical protein
MRNKKYEIRSFQDLSTLVNEKNVDMLCGNLYGAIRQFIEMRKQSPELKFMGIDWIDDGKLKIKANPNIVLIVQDPEPEPKPKMSDKKLSYNPKLKQKKTKTPSVKDIVYSFKTTAEKGFTGEDIAKLLKEYFPKITPRQFNKKMGIVTCSMENGKFVYYHSDVELAIRLCIEKRGPTQFEFD